MPFKITVEGESFTTLDLSIDELCEVEEVTGRTWWELNPAASARDFRAFAIVWLTRKHGKELARAKVGALNYVAALDAVEFQSDSDLPDVYENNIPKKGGAPGTSGSSGAPADGDGPPTSPDDSPSAT